MPPKPGYKTTEFWLTFAAVIVGLALESGAFGGTIMNGLGLAAAALASAGYSWSRGIAKKAGP